MTSVITEPTIRVILTHTHKKSQYEGVRYVCDQCDYRATHQGNLTSHKKSQHEGVRYYCDQCDYEATTHSHLTTKKIATLRVVCYVCKEVLIIFVTFATRNSVKECI